LHPGLILFVIAILTTLKKEWQKPLFLLAPILSLIILFSVFITTITIYHLMIAVSILIVLFANNIFTIFNSQTIQTRDLQLSLIYIGAGLSIILTKHLIAIFLFLELMMFAGTLLIFNGHNLKSKTAGLSYLKIHILSGTLFLIGLIIIIISHESIIITTITLENLNLGQTLILCALLINIALPPFSYWLTEGYIAASPFGSTILSVCTTKISVLLLAELFLGMPFLIYIGIFMGVYGIIYMLLETHIRKILTFSIISEIGIILISIGVGNFNIAMSLIITNIFYISLLMMCTGNFDLFSNAQHYFEITKIPNKKLTMAAYILTVFSISSLPLTPGYFNKYELIQTIINTNQDWLISVLNGLNVGMILSLCFKTLNFTFFYNKKIQNITVKNNNMGIYMLITFTIFLYFLVPLYVNKQQIFDVKIIKQTLWFLVAYCLFKLLQKQLYFKNSANLIEPDFLYRTILCSVYFFIHKSLAELFKYTTKNYDAISRKLNLTKVRRLGQQQKLSDSKYLNMTILLVIAILIFILINILLLRLS
jgi:multicomponent Na+:H+ antiporter subunit D